MEETGQWECPFYHRVVGEDECYDLHLVAMRMFEAPEIVREEDCGSLKLFRPRVCACCGKSIVGFYGVCRVCGWENDPLQNERPDYGGGANRMSLNEAQTAYSQGEEIY